MSRRIDMADLGGGVKAHCGVWNDNGPTSYEGCNEAATDEHDFQSSNRRTTLSMVYLPRHPLLVWWRGVAFFPLWCGVVWGPSWCSLARMKFQMVW